SSVIEVRWSVSGLSGNRINGFDVTLVQPGNLSKSVNGAARSITFIVKDPDKQFLVQLKTRFSFFPDPVIVTKIFPASEINDGALGSPTLSPCNSALNAPKVEVLTVRDTKLQSCINSGKLCLEVRFNAELPCEGGFAFDNFSVKTDLNLRSGANFSGVATFTNLVGASGRSALTAHSAPQNPNDFESVTVTITAKFFKSGEIITTSKGSF
ncbi:MAG: hypothetical protein ACRENG_25055, partial [bacterium]